MQFTTDRISGCGALLLFGVGAHLDTAGCSSHLVRARLNIDRRSRVGSDHLRDVPGAALARLHLDSGLEHLGAGHTTRQNVLTEIHVIFDLLLHLVLRRLMMQLLLEWHRLISSCLVLDAGARVLRQVSVLAEVLGRVALNRIHLRRRIADVLLALGGTFGALCVLGTLHVVLYLGQALSTVET